jgi:hypothetical protein
MHTGQDRRIQTELDVTLAKNATKPNPFEIISLQTTRKKNNWKTEETLARAVVTLETERIKGPVLDVYEDDGDDDNANAVYVGIYHVMILLRDGFQCWRQD